MVDSTVEARQDLVDHLEGIVLSLRSCAQIEQRLTHAPHIRSDYLELINRVSALVDAERALNKRIQTVGR